MPLDGIHGHDEKMRQYLKRGWIVARQNKAVSAGFASLSLVAIYDSFSGGVTQVLGVKLPTLRELFGMSLDVGGQLLPWWGWVIVLLASLNVTLLFRGAPPRRAVEPIARPDVLAEYLSSNPMTNPRHPVGTIPPPITPERLLRAAEKLPNWQKIIRDWSRVETYELYQAAALWAGVPPPAVSILPLTPEGQANLAMLKAAIRRGDLQPTLDDAPSYIRLGPTETTCVTREALIAYAEQKGEHPAFLFSDV